MASITTIGGIIIVHINVRSLRANYDYFCDLMNESKPHVICVSETWLSNEIYDFEVCLPEYNILRVDRQWKDNANIDKGGGGIAIFYKNNINCDAGIYENLKRSTINIENMWIKLKFDNIRPIVVGLVYRPWQGNHETFLETIRHDYEIVCDGRDKDVFILGDYNIDYFMKQDPKRKNLKLMEKTCGLRQLINDITRFGHENEKDSCIDLILTNSEYVSESGTLDFAPSDHEIIYVVRKKDRQIPEKTTFRARPLRLYDKKSFYKELDKKDWNKCLENVDLDNESQLFINNIIESLDVTCPELEYKSKKVTKPWMTNELLELGKEKDRLIRKSKRNKKDLDLKTRANKIKNQYNNSIRKTKSEFHREILGATDKKNEKKYWSNIHQFTKGKKDAREQIFLKDDDGENVPIEETADFINQFFANVGEKLANKIKKKVWSYDGDVCADKLSNFDTDESEIEKLIHEIDINK